VQYVAHESQFLLNSSLFGGCQAIVLEIHQALIFFVKFRCIKDCTVPRRAILVRVLETVQVTASCGPFARVFAPRAFVFMNVFQTF
jgi:hypothetical protein